MSYDKVYVSAWVTANRKFMLLYEILKKSSTDNQLINVIHFVLSLGQSNFSTFVLNTYKHLKSFSVAMKIRTQKSATQSMMPRVPMPVS